MLHIYFWKRGVLCVDDGTPFWRVFPLFNDSSSRKKVYVDKDQVQQNPFQEEKLTMQFHSIAVKYLNIKGIDKALQVSPKISDSCAILCSTLLVISPKYIPEIIFSKPYSTA